MKPVRRVATGIRAAIRARPGTFLGVSVLVVALDLFLPVLVLSVSRKPVDFFTFNAWLSRLPEFLLSADVPLGRKLEFLPRLALFWFSADSPYAGTEWGYAVDAVDLVRFLLTGLLVGAYLSLWLHGRTRRVSGGLATPAGGVLGGVTSVLGLSTGPCSVMGCGAPVLPVVGLAFVGLTSGTLALLATLSRVATAVVLLGLLGGCLYLAWRVGGDVTAGPSPATRGSSSSPPPVPVPAPAAPRR